MPSRQHFEIEPRAADKDRHGAACVNIGNLCLRACRPGSGRARFAPVPCAEQAVFDAFHLILGRARREDLQIGVDLRRVGVDDHANTPDLGKPVGQSEGNRALAAGGRPCNERER